MRLQWINHASFLMSVENTHLLVDPWFEGRVFNESWALHSPTAFSDEGYRALTDLWISHEHPDHFSLPTLKKFPAETRKRIRVHYQSSQDKRVVEALARLGFANVTELGTAPAQLEPNVSLLGPPFLHGDSWMFLRSPQGSLLNLNDCNTDESSLREIARRCGPVDVLVAQFSYASWPGNRADVASQKKVAASVLSRLLLQCELVKPRFVVPAASYVWFCHPDNFHMNETANRVGDVARTIAAKTQARPIVLYPGDIWTLGEPHDFAPAAEKYARDLETLREPSTLTPLRRVSEADLVEHGNAFIRKLIQYNQTLRMFFLEPARIYVTDLEKHFLLSPLRGFVETAETGRIPDVELGSDALDFAFRFGWGGETLLVSGRYEVPAGGNFARFYSCFHIALTNNRAQKYPSVGARARHAVAAALPRSVRSTARRMLGGMSAGWPKPRGLGYLARLSSLQPSSSLWAAGQRLTSWAGGNEARSALDG